MTRRYSLGPELRHLLDEQEETLTATCQHEFERLLASRLKQNQHRVRHLLALVAELIDVRLPLLALQLLARPARGNRGNDDEFEVIFWRGVACLATGDVWAAKKNFSRAHRLCPDEIAVHSQLAAILQREGNRRAAQRWLRAGLQVERNAVQLWLALHQLCSAETLLALAEELSAWRGGSLYAQLTGDVAAALALYRRIFAGGERGGEFLIEFSGALGHRDCCHELSALAWQVLEQGALPWQVYEHFAQGFTQLGNAPQARRCAVLAQNARAQLPR